jgi:hypothetical protein
LARRNLRELDERHVTGQGLRLRDETTGETLEVITSLVDLVDPKSSGAVAFTIRDSLLVVLRPLGWRHEDDRSVKAGEIYGRPAEPRDPLPMPSGLEIR